LLKIATNEAGGTAKRSHFVAQALARCAVILIGGCTLLSPQKPASSPTAASGTPAQEKVDAGLSLSLTMHGYKRDVAKQIYRANPQHLFEGAPPPMLKSVVVLEIKVDSEGKPTYIRVLRSNRYKELEALAMQSVRAAAPLPRPNRFVMRRGVAEFVETWLFRNDGHFQIRTLAEAQADSEER
jgi:protein TonB